jgi:hypothetical protein
MEVESGRCSVFSLENLRYSALNYIRLVQNHSAQCRITCGVQRKVRVGLSSRTRWEKGTFDRKWLAAYRIRGCVLSLRMKRFHPTLCVISTPTVLLIILSLVSLY